MRRPPVRLLALLCGVALAGTGCASAAPPPDGPDAADWPAVLTAARGQTVDWYMYTGDDAVNRVVEGYVGPRLAEEFGVTLNVVPVADTGDAVNKVLAERQAGRRGTGTVDAIWLNGENFATGKQGGLWRCGYPAQLPNSRFLDPADPALATDFGVPVEGCEAAWQRANSALVYDSARLAPSAVASLSSLQAWARANPGRFTYPAPPDFTGSMVVRTFLLDIAGSALPEPFDPAAFAPLGDRLAQRLNALEPALWRGGRTYPTSQEALERLYATGEVSAYFTYGPGTVASKVADGTYPATTRTAVPDPGSIANTSYVALPADSADAAAGLVLANLLQDPETQLRFYADGGLFPAIDVDRLPDGQRARFDAVRLGPAVLPPAQLAARALPEPSAAYADAADEAWTTGVLRR